MVACASGGVGSCCWRGCLSGVVGTGGTGDVAVPRSECRLRDVARIRLLPAASGAVGMDGGLAGGDAKPDEWSCWCEVDMCRRMRAVAVAVIAEEGGGIRAGRANGADGASLAKGDGRSILRSRKSLCWYGEDIAYDSRSAVVSVQVYRAIHFATLPFSLLA